MVPWIWVIVWSRVLPETLVVSYLVNKLCILQNPKAHGTQHLSLSWVRSVYSTSSQLMPLKSILLLSSLLCIHLPSGLLSSGFPIKTMYVPFSSPCMPHATPISPLIWFIWSPRWYLVNSTHHEAFQCAVFFSPPLPHPSYAQISYSASRFWMPTAYTVSSLTDFQLLHLS